MKRYDVYGIGNALVDMEFEVTPAFLEEMRIEKGLMTLVDEVRQSQIVQSMHGIQHRRSCGGSAANTLIALAHLGGKSFYSCKVADDEVGEFYVADLERSGVTTNLKARRDAGVSGRCMVFITPDADRTMNTYLGISATLSKNEIMPEALQDSRYLYIEGYIMASPHGREAAHTAKQLAQAAGVKTSLTFSDPGIVTYFREHFRELIGTGLDLIFCNEAEAMAFTGTSDVYGAARELGKVAQSFAITRGPKGALLCDGQREIHVLPPKVEAIDTNGAGDAFAGCVLYGLTQGHGFGDAGRLACAASSKLVTQFGARLEQEQILYIRKDVLDT